MRYLSTRELISKFWDNISVRQFTREIASKKSNLEISTELKEDIISQRLKLAGKWEKYLKEISDKKSLPQAVNGYPAFRVKKFRLRNIGVFSDTGEVELSSNAALLLGNNATGKSTVLKCLALAAAGSDAANEVELSAQSYLRKGTEQGSIEVMFDLIPDPGCYPEEYGSFAAGLRIDAETKRFTPLHDTSIKRLNEIRADSGLSFGLICAYGATRTFSDNRFGLEPELPDENEWITPLFRWDARITNPDLLSKLIRGDLRNIKDAPDKLQSEWQQAIADALMRLLPSVENFQLSGASDVTFNNTELKFSELSDGYRSLLTILGHLIRSAFKLTQWQTDPTKFHGIVLIDEIDLHLHPSWQKSVLTDLRNAFPNIQFIVSTHSPMVAGSLDAASILVMQYEDEKSKIENLSRLMTETQSMKLWRADQILTGPGFGLESSMSKEAQAWEDEYSELYDIAPENRTEEQQNRLEELSDLLDREILHPHETEKERAAVQLIEETALEKGLKQDTLNMALKMFHQFNSPAN